MVSFSCITPELTTERAKTVEPPPPLMIKTPRLYMVPESTEPEPVTSIEPELSKNDVASHPPDNMYSPLAFMRISPVITVSPDWCTTAK